MRQFLLIFVISLFALPASAQSENDKPAESLASTGVDLDEKFHIVTQEDISRALQVLRGRHRTQYGDYSLEVEILAQPNQELTISSGVDVYDRPERYYLMPFNLWTKDGVSVPCRPKEPPRPKTKPCHYKKIIRDNQTAVAKN